MKKTNWSKEELDYLINNYEAFSYKELASYLDRSVDAVRIKSKKLGLTRRYTYNRKFFQNIDNEDKAYWLGFIAADGYITHTCSYCIGIELQKEDIAHLKKFNKTLTGNIPIEIRRKAHNFGDREISSDVAIFRLFDKNMYEDLMKYSITPRKTSDLKFASNIPNHLLKDYIRGYFDGNGTICLHKVKQHIYIRATISSGSEDFITTLRSVLFEKYQISSYIVNDKNAFKLEIGGNDNVKKFLDLIYEHAQISLDRKYKRYLSYSERYM